MSVLAETVVLGRVLNSHKGKLPIAVLIVSVLADTVVLEKTKAHSELAQR